MKRNWDNLPALEVAMKTLEQIGSISPRSRASVQARTTYVFIETMLGEAKCHDQKIADKIMAHVSRSTGYLVSEMKSRQRHYGVCFARHVAIALVRRNTSFCVQKIADVLGMKDHASVLYALKRIAERLTEKERAVFEKIKASLTI